MPTYVWAMCNLYRMPRSTAEVARLFTAEAAQGANVAEEVYPGYPGLVVAEGCTRAMTWGFPLAITGKQGQALKPKPVNNARDDKLGTAFWRDSFNRRRCLIPVTAWAEAEGERGRMTRTWHSLPGDEPFAIAGIWRPTAEWGDAFAMVMSDSCDAMAKIHNRMPVVLQQEAWDQWLAGTPTEAVKLCQPWAAKLTIERTGIPWAQRIAPAPSATMDLFG